MFTDQNQISFARTVHAIPGGEDQASLPGSSPPLYSPLLVPSGYLTNDTNIGIIFHAVRSCSSRRGSGLLAWTGCQTAGQGIPGDGSTWNLRSTVDYAP